MVKRIRMPEGCDSVTFGHEGFSPVNMQWEFDLPDHVAAFMLRADNPARGILVPPEPPPTVQVRHAHGPGSAVVHRGQTFRADENGFLQLPPEVLSELPWRVHVEPAEPAPAPEVAVASLLTSPPINAPPGRSRGRDHRC